METYFPFCFLLMVSSFIILYVLSYCQDFAPQKSAFVKADLLARLEVAGEAENAAEGIGGVFVRADGNGVDTHLDDGVIVPSWLGHIAKV